MLKTAASILSISTVSFFLLCFGAIVDLLLCLHWKSWNNKIHVQWLSLPLWGKGPQCQITHVKLKRRETGVDVLTRTVKVDGLCSVSFGRFVFHTWIIYNKFSVYLQSLYCDEWFNLTLEFQFRYRDSFQLEIWCTNADFTLIYPNNSFFSQVEREDVIRRTGVHDKKTFHFGPRQLNTNEDVALAKFHAPGPMKFKYSSSAWKKLLSPTSFSCRCPQSSRSGELLSRGTSSTTFTDAEAAGFLWWNPGVVLGRLPPCDELWGMWSLVMLNWNLLCGEKSCW